MNELFDIPVFYNGQDLSFKAGLLRYGYTHRIIVTVSDSDVVFEPDEEGNYRALNDQPESSRTRKDLDFGLLQAIAEAIEAIVK